MVLAPIAIERQAGKRVVDVKARLAAGVPVQPENEAPPRKYLRSSRISIGIESLLCRLAGRYDGFIFGFITILCSCDARDIRAIGHPFQELFTTLNCDGCHPLGLCGCRYWAPVVPIQHVYDFVFRNRGLVGVVVNDSLVLIDAANQRRKEGASAFEAIILGNPSLATHSPYFAYDLFWLGSFNFRAQCTSEVSDSNGVEFGIWTYVRHVRYSFGRTCDLHDCG